MKKPRHQVSDHAVLRYLQRAQGIDVEALRLEIGRRIDQAVARCEAELGPIDTSAAHIDGVTFVVKDSVVVTVLERKGSNRRDG